jgi:hypothetical protein
MRELTSPNCIRNPSRPIAFSKQSMASVGCDAVKPRPPAPRNPGMPQPIICHLTPARAMHALRNCAYSLAVHPGGGLSGF